MGTKLVPVQYYQWDEKWAMNDYSAKGEKTTIKAEGCGVAVSAMALTSLTGKTITPADTAKWSLAHGYKACKQGTYYSYFEPQFKEYGLKCKQVSYTNCYHKPNAKEHKIALEAIENGDWCVAVMGKGHFTSSGHYVLWYGMEDGKALIRDPWNDKPNLTKADYKMFCNEVKYYWIITVPEKFKEAKYTVEKDKVIIDGKEYEVNLIRHEGVTYLKTRDVGELLGYKVSNDGKVPVLEKK